MTTELNPALKLGDLIEQLESEIDRYEISTSEALARAYVAGADQQLAEDAKWLDCNALNEAHLKTIPVGGLLKEAMRPKPPTNAEIHALADELLDGDSASRVDFARAVLARWGKPPSLKEQAKFAAAVLRSPDETCSIAELQQHWHTICNALEQLND